MTDSTEAANTAAASTKNAVAAVKSLTKREIEKQLQAELGLLKPSEKVVVEKSAQQIERERRIDLVEEEYAAFTDTVLGYTADAERSTELLGALRNLRLARDKTIKVISEIEDSAIALPIKAEGF